jgi:hypothetical protein
MRTDGRRTSLRATDPYERYPFGAAARPSLPAPKSGFVQLQFPRRWRVDGTKEPNEALLPAGVASPPSRRRPNPALEAPHQARDIPAKLPSAVPALLIRPILSCNLRAFLVIPPTIRSPQPGDPLRANSRPVCGLVWVKIVARQTTFPLRVGTRLFFPERRTRMTCSRLLRGCSASALAAALVFPAAPPAAAQPWHDYHHGYYYHDHHGNNTGAVVAGALLGLGVGAALGSVLAAPPQAYAPPPPVYYAAPPPPAYYAPPPPAGYGYYAPPAGY